MRRISLLLSLLLCGAITVDLDGLPPPRATPSVSNPAAVVEAPAGWKPKVAEGFTVGVFAEGLRGPRNLLVVGDALLVAEQFADRVIKITADGEKTLCQKGLDRPYGLAAQPGMVYVADTVGVWQFAECGDPPQMITAAGELGDGRGHSTRNLAFSPDGDYFFVAIGSRGNIDIEPPPRATIRRFAASGGSGETYASGLRNPVGLAFHPKSGELWATVVERDRMGDELVPDYLAPIKENGFYGWPYYYLGNPQPGFADAAPYPPARSVIPPILFLAHSSPLGMAFWGGDAFVALHGSWNSSRPRGFMVARVRFDANGGPVANAYEPFLTGFADEGRDGGPLVRGRPAGVAVLSDDELLVADDVAGKIWKISR